jgi:hypothetical protein
MKIKIITNTFNDYHRQKVAVDSWLHLKNLYPEMEVINLQFFDEQEQFSNFYPDLTTKFLLRQSSQSYLGSSEKKLPLVRDLFNAGVNEDCEYFITTNSDVIIMPSLIEYIQNKKPDAMACSRLDIEEISSFQSIVDQKVVPVRWEPAGFDTFVFKKEWAVKNKHLFQNPYFLGKPKYDVVWAGYMKIFGDNTPLGNDYPPYCFHIHHGNSACYLECIEKDWNHAILRDEHLDCLMHNIMVLHLKTNLLKRTPWGAFLNIQNEEKQVEKDFFDILNIHNID